MTSGSGAWVTGQQGTSQKEPAAEVPPPPGADTQAAETDRPATPTEGPSTSTGRPTTPLEVRTQLQNIGDELVGELMTGFNYE